ncbi:conserved hypothetical protein [Flavobacterium psychrophilum]|uniref:hypothetical protein n=1 Tax=Flavobacterium psychrophilum TaxID=96345 RepID=UPI000B7C12BC|nr:hypothetical protein [Flavobacterium psychrophilum]SNB29693.1 conserved hypothetical protein [Flavobacterium psychrophilum]
MEKFDKTNPYNPNATKSNKINLGKKKLPKWAKITLIWIASSIALIFIIAIVSLINETPQEKKAREELAIQNEKQEQIQRQKEAEIERIKNLPKYEKMDALVQSQLYIESKLKSPGSAKFDISIERVIKSNDTIFTVISFVDSQNGFGALLRTNYSCKVIFHPKTDTHDIENVIMQ